jgi:hypothetical protein
MRRPVDASRVRRFMRSLGRASTGGSGGEGDVRVYLTGGATAVLLGFRPSTIDIDLTIEPDSDRLWRELPRLKEELEVNVEPASPADFIPELPGWRERSRFISREGRLSFFHYDLYAQALAKIERGHGQDLGDVGEMLARGLIERTEVLRFFDHIEPALYRYPAIDPPSFRRAVEDLVRK